MDVTLEITLINEGATLYINEEESSTFFRGTPDQQLKNPAAKRAAVARALTLLAAVIVEDE